MKKYSCESPEETFLLGQKFGETASPGSIFCLEGDLGAGKTVFAQGFARGLGIDEYVDSPTFTLVKEYDGGRLHLCHMDVYRIEDEDEMYETGFEEMFFGKGVCLVEWASRIPDLIPASAMWIHIDRKDGCGEDFREISVEEA